MFKGGNNSNMNQMMKQAKKWQEDMQRMQQELHTKSYEGSAGGGAIKVSVNGAGRLQAVTIDKEVIDPEDAETLQELIVIAANNALDAMAKVNEQEMGKLTGGLNLPGLF